MDYIVEVMKRYPDRWQTSEIRFADQNTAIAFAEEQETDFLTHVRSRIIPVVACSCGEEVICSNTWTNFCDCGAEYNRTGQELAPRSQWGEETGERFY